MITETELVRRLHALADSFDPGGGGAFADTQLDDGGAGWWDDPLAAVLDRARSATGAERTAAATLEHSYVLAAAALGDGNAEGDAARGDVIVLADRYPDRHPDAQNTPRPARPTTWRRRLARHSTELGFAAAVLIVSGGFVGLAHLGGGDESQKSSSAASRYNGPVAAASSAAVAAAGNTVAAGSAGHDPVATVAGSAQVGQTPSAAARAPRPTPPRGPQGPDRPAAAQPACAAGGSATARIGAIPAQLSAGATVDLQVSAPRSASIVAVDVFALAARGTVVGAVHPALHALGRPVPGGVDLGGTLATWSCRRGSSPSTYGGPVSNLPAGRYRLVAVVHYRDGSLAHSSPVAIVVAEKVVSKK